MQRPWNFRTARFAALFCALSSMTGCWTLNQWSGPSQDPFFSVPDALDLDSEEELAAPEPEAHHSSAGWRAANAVRNL